MTSAPAATRSCTSPIMHSATRTVDAQLLHGHEGDFGAQVGSFGQGQDRILFAQLAIVSQAAARLTHEPHRGGIGWLESTGSQQPLGSGHRMAGQSHPSSSSTSATLPATHVKIGVSRSVYAL